MRRAALLLIGLGVAAEVLVAAHLLTARTQAMASRHAAETAVAAPALALASGQSLTAPHGDAGARLAALLADRGSAAGVRLVTRPAGSSPSAGLAVLDLEANGPEAALRAFARATERGYPLVRFLHWTLRPAGAGTLRLSATAAAPLRPIAAPASPTARIALHPYPGQALASGGTSLFADATTLDAAPAGGRGALPQLLGIVGRVSAPEAMVRGRDDSVRTLPLGASIDGWTLAAITADRVRFRRGAEERTAVLPPQADAQ